MPVPEKVDKSQYVQKRETEGPGRPKSFLSVLCYFPGIQQRLELCTLNPSLSALVHSELPRRKDFGILFRAQTEIRKDSVVAY
jgi:hypothetical protein